MVEQNSQLQFDTVDQTVIIGRSNIYTRYVMQQSAFDKGKFKELKEHLLTIKKNKQLELARKLEEQKQKECTMQELQLRFNYAMNQLNNGGGNQINNNRNQINEEYCPFRCDKCNEKWKRGHCIECCLRIPENKPKQCTYCNQKGHLIKCCKKRFNDQHPKKVRQNNNQVEEEKVNIEGPREMVIIPEQNVQPIQQNIPQRIEFLALVKEKLMKANLEEYNKVISTQSPIITKEFRDLILQIITDIKQEPRDIFVFDFKYNYSEQKQQELLALLKSTKGFGSLWINRDVMQGIWVIDHWMYFDDQFDGIGCGYEVPEDDISDSMHVNWVIGCQYNGFNFYLNY